MSCQYDNLISTRLFLFKSIFCEFAFEPLEQLYVYVYVYVSENLILLIVHLNFCLFFVCLQN